MQPISYTTINLTLPSPLVLPCPLPGVARDFCVLFALYIFLLCPCGVLHTALLVHLVHHDNSTKTERRM